jgi:hypothetical protein
MAMNVRPSLRGKSFRRNLRIEFRDYVRCGALRAIAGTSLYMVSTFILPPPRPPYQTQPDLPRLICTNYLVTSRYALLTKQDISKICYLLVNYVFSQHPELTD